MKKVLAVILMVILIFSLFSVLVFAESNMIAYSNIQIVKIDGKEVKFNTYAIKDSEGYPTNYIKLRDLACALSGTDSEFEVEWNRKINLITNQKYTLNGSEMALPFSGDRTYSENKNKVLLNGEEVDTESIILMDSMGGGYTYFKLRDLAQLLNFSVCWSDEESMIHINTGYFGFYNPICDDGYVESIVPFENIELTEDGKVNVFHSGMQKKLWGSFRKEKGELLFEADLSGYEITYENGVLVADNENNRVYYEKTDVANLAGSYVYSGESDNNILIRLNADGKIEGTSISGKWKFDSGMIIAESNEQSEKLTLKPLNDYILYSREAEGASENYLFKKINTGKFEGVYISDTHDTIDIRKNGSCEVYDKSTEETKDGIWYLSKGNEITVVYSSDSSRETLKFSDEKNIERKASDKLIHYKRNEIPGVYYTTSGFVLRGMQTYEADVGDMLNKELLFPSDMVVYLEENGDALFVNNNLEKKGSWLIVNNLPIICFEDAYSCIYAPGKLNISLPSPDGKSTKDFSCEKHLYEEIPFGNYEFSYGVEITENSFEQIKPDEQGIDEDYMKLELCENGEFSFVDRGGEVVKGKWVLSESKPFELSLETENKTEFSLYVINEKIIFCNKENSFCITFLKKI